MLAQLGQDATNRTDVLRLAAREPMAIEDTNVISVSSMHLRWGAFLANGDERHIVSIFDAMGSDRPGLTVTARNALAQSAVAHPRVMDICRAQLDKQPEEIRSTLRAAFMLATPNRNGS